MKIPPGWESSRYGSPSPHQAITAGARRLEEGHVPLDGGVVRASEKTDGAGAPGLPGRPLDHVVEVTGLRSRERIDRAGDPAHAPAVHPDADVASRHPVEGVGAHQVLGEPHGRNGLLGRAALEPGVLPRLAGSSALLVADRTHAEGPAVDTQADDHRVPAVGYRAVDVGQQVRPVAQRHADVGQLLDAPTGSPLPVAGLGNQRAGVRARRFRCLSCNAHLRGVQTAQWPRRRRRGSWSTRYVAARARAGALAAVDVMGKTGGAGFSN